MFSVGGILFYIIVKCSAIDYSFCRERGTYLWDIASYEFEISPWVDKQVDLNSNIESLRAFVEAEDHVDLTARTKDTEISQRQMAVSVVGSEISVYAQAVLLEFLEMYERQLKNSYNDYNTKMTKIIKEETSKGIQKRHDILTQLTKMADRLVLPPMCNEERRAIRTLASKHLADVYECTQKLKSDMVKVSNYANEIISITSNSMKTNLDRVLASISRTTNKTIISSHLTSLSRAATLLGYKLDLSIVNMNKHNENSCNKYTKCVLGSHERSDQSVRELREQLNYCVYA